MRTDELDFHLPPELIAQSPTERRGMSRLLHYDSATKAVGHRTFPDLPALLRPGDLLVFNDARVIRARFMLRKNTGGRIEGLFLGEIRLGAWRVMLRNVGLHVGRAMVFERDESLSATVIEPLGGGEYALSVETDASALAVLDRVGRIPLPPYIRRDKGADPRDADDAERYQTVYARAPGSVAAPTAGLHFTPELLHELDRRGIERTFVTLHVGVGTFKPVSSANLEDHVMHREGYDISSEATDALNRAKTQCRRIVAVGTTSARVLESQPADAAFIARSADTDIFIRPPYSWKHVGALVTNFHLPRSTLIALVAAKVGLAEQRRIYDIAIAERYRFFSYGDAMVVE